MFLFAVSATKEQYFAKSQNKHSHQNFQQMAVISVNYAVANGPRLLGTTTMLNKTKFKCEQLNKRENSLTARQQPQ